MTYAVANEVPRVDAGLFRFTEFFDGEAQAWGVFIDRFGVIRQHMTVQLKGGWRGSTFHIDEVFTYGTGERETRTWTVQDIDDRTFTAACPDCVGPVAGENGPDSLRMSYDYNLPMGGRRVVVSFDDRMYRLSDTRVFNRATMKKFGVTIGHVTLFVEKTASRTQDVAR